MDINNYSYSVMGDSENVITEYSGEYAAPVVAFTLVHDGFGDYYYYVNDIISGTCGEFPFSAIDLYTERSAYESAARLYNSLVPDACAVPLF